MIKRLLGAASALFTLTGAAPAADPAELFGVRESVESIALSPDGSYVAYVSPTEGQGSALYTVDLSVGRSELATILDGEMGRFGECNFVSSSRIICSVHKVTELPRGQGLAVTTQLVTVDSDGGTVKLLNNQQSLRSQYVALGGAGIIDWLPGQENQVLMTRWEVPDDRTGSRIGSREEGYSVERVDTLTLATEEIEPARQNAVRYITDGRGNIRMMGLRDNQGSTGQITSRVRYSYRLEGSDEWHDFGVYDWMTKEGRYPLAVDPELNAAYVLKKMDGRDALYRVKLDGTMTGELVLERDDVDVGGLVRIGRQRRVVGATYHDDYGHRVYFDPELKALSKALGQALPGLPLIRFVDSSLDGNKLLLWAGSDTDPGRYYVYDADGRRLDEIMLSRPRLEGVVLAEVKPVSYPARDGVRVPGYLTLPPGSDGNNLPAIVLPHGGPSARDHWGFDWLVQFFANRGFAVLQPNFRGSEGYGDAWFQRNGFQSWETAIGDVNDAGRWLVAQGIADPEKLAVLGWSYGGYAALQSSVTDPGLFKAVVAVAPVTDLEMLKEESRGWTNSAVTRDFIGSGPHIEAGSPARRAAGIGAPVLMFHGDEDINVDVRQSRLMEGRLQAAGKEVELVIYPGLDHYLEDSAARANMLRRSDAFLRAAMGM